MMKKFVYEVLTSQLLPKCQKILKLTPKEFFNFSKVHLMIYSM